MRIHNTVAACAALMAFAAYLTVLSAANSPVADAAMKGDIAQVRTLLGQNADVNGVQAEITAMVEELHTIFVDEKLLNPDTDLWGIYDAATAKWSNPSADVPLTVTEAVANAMWNYKFVVYDKSMGVHNSDYTRALLQQALDAMK